MLATIFNMNPTSFKNSMLISKSFSYISLVLWLLSYFTMQTQGKGVRVSPSIMTRNIEEENGPPVLAESIEGTLGLLPCNLTPPIFEDRVALVIWYKVGLKTPIYSVDTRESNFSEGAHWSDEAYRERLSFNVEERSGTLTMKKTQEDDTGEYRCRVDFQKSPTRNSKVNLTVITPPESIIILDSKGVTVEDHKLGPYNEGAIINITCVAVGGRPQPKVTWWHEHVLLDSSAHPLSDRRVGNVLSLGKLKRKNLNMQLTCRAANNNLTMPITSTVTLDMNLRPLIVKLQGENRPLSAQNSYQLSCTVIGSRPAPTITWWKGSTPMKDTHEIANPDGNMTTSILTFTPTIDDRGKFLSCRAEQSMIPESGMEDGWKLDIYHTPVVSLELGTNSMNSTLREGIDVFFECNIKSNPWVYKVSWRHNGNILENNIAEGIIVANQSLVLQNVSRARSGIYTCVGVNREGDGESNPVQLDIKFAPVCRSGQRTAYSSARQETVKIVCEIEANPADATFVWKFNSTNGEIIDIPANVVAVDRGRSVAHYTPMVENDYGTLWCWASNEIGDQTEPCMYTITPAGEPDALVNCTLLNQTSTGFQIECIEGFDGGLQQDFIMEVYVNGTTRHPKIYKSKTPYFEVRGLIPGAGYNVFLIAHNNKGRSNATILQVYTLKDPEKQTVELPISTPSSTLNQAVNADVDDVDDEASDDGDDDYDDDVVKTELTTSLATRTQIAIARQSINKIQKSNDRNLSLAYAPVIEDIRPFLGILAGIVGSLFLVALIIVVIVRMRGSTGRDRNNYTHSTATGGNTGNGNTVGGRNNNNNGGVSIGALHNGQSSIQDIRNGRDTCHVTSSLDSIDKNPDIIPQDGCDVDDDEWTTKGHNRAFATAALAEQNAITSGYDHLIPTYAVVDKKTAAAAVAAAQQQHLQQQQHHQQQQQLHGQYVQYNTLIPASKMSAYAASLAQHQQHQQHLQNKTDLNYAELAPSGAQRLAPYCTATLGRPRQSELKRAEPNIYSQIDLAHHTMYSTSPMFGTHTTITGGGVTMSHPSQLATFTPTPPIFAHKVITATPSSTSNSSSAQLVSGCGVGVGVAVSSNGLLQPMTAGGNIVCMSMSMPGSTGGAGKAQLGIPHSTASIICATQQQQQQQQSESPPLIGGGSGSIVGLGIGTFGETNSNSGILKTVPEELHHQLNGEELLLTTSDRSHTTRF